MNELWSYILTLVGVTGFILAGKRVWWSWYINLGCQALWVIYALTTKQYGFLGAAALYTFVFGKNAFNWTRDHFERKSGVGKYGNKFKVGDIIELKDRYVGVVNPEIKLRITKTHEKNGRVHHYEYDPVNLPKVPDGEWDMEAAWLERHYKKV